jgi:hypothetical protein
MKGSEDDYELDVDDNDDYELDVDDNDDYELDVDDDDDYESPSELVEIQNEQVGIWLDGLSPATSSFDFMVEGNIG